MTVLDGSVESRRGILLRAIPRTSALLASVLFHVAALTSIILLRHTAEVHFQSAKYKVVPINPRPAHVSSVYLPPKSGPGRPKGIRPHLSRQQLLSRQLRLEIPYVKYQGQDEILHEEASRWTLDVNKSLNFHGVYLNHVYQLAVLVSGDLPVISAEELPPHFQSYVIVEVTIDTDGRPALVHTVAGVVTPAIERKLLAAIRDFRYIPAKRDGLPVPSQRDIVIHIPS